MAAVASIDIFYYLEFLSSSLDEPNTLRETPEIGLEKHVLLLSKKNSINIRLLHSSSKDRFSSPIFLTFLECFTNKINLFFFKVNSRA